MQDGEHEQHDRGNGWVHRWIANPFAKGSIPSSVSTSKRYKLGRRVARFLIDRGSPLQHPFWSGLYQGMFNHFDKRERYKSPDYERLEVMFRAKHDQLAKMTTDFGNLREKHIAASKELSRMKRSKTP